MFEPGLYISLYSVSPLMALALVQSMAELVELISDLRALKSLHRAEAIEQARVVDGSVIPVRHRLRTVEARHPVALKIMRMNV